MEIIKYLNKEGLTYYTQKILSAVENTGKSRTGSNMDQCLEPGVYPWCTLGRPAGSKGAYTLIVWKSSDADNQGYYTIQQTAFGRQDELGSIYQRIIFQKHPDIVEYGNWILISSNNAIVRQTEESVSISPNVLNVWGNMERLNINLTEGNRDQICEYMIQFSCGDVSTQLTLPGVKWSNEPEFEANHTYQISIVNNLAVYAGWEN